MKRKLIDLTNQRNAALQEAETALNANDTAAYDRAMERVHNLNTEMERVQDLISEQARQALDAVPSAGEVRDAAEERANILRNGGAITFSAIETLRGLRNAAGDGTLVSGSIVQPTGTSGNVNDNLGASVLPSLVRVEDMTGLGSWDEPYLISDPTVAVGKPETVAGTSRTRSEPTFGYAQIKPYEVSITSYIDRNIANLSPVAYMAKVQRAAMRALLNKIAALILLGDSEETRVMYGMLNGADKNGTSLVKTVNATVASSKGKIDENLLTQMFFAYGNDYEVGGNAMLFCNKTDLKAWGSLRGTNEKRRIFDIAPLAGQANRGTIADGGMIIPYLLDPSLTAVDGTDQAASTGADKLCAIYGDPQNYLLGLFGNYTIRIDEHVKSVERLHTILGDAVVGGNVVAKDGFVVAKIPKAAAAG
ncbi:MAG: phage major capsid protein [Oscillospiraceae bacterium]|nr:phage major capsid protein [Oscillospiraceae bacterium]